MKRAVGGVAPESLVTLDECCKHLEVSRAELWQLIQKKTVSVHTLSDDEKSPTAIQHRDLVRLFELVASKARRNKESLDLGAIPPPETAPESLWKKVLKQEQQNEQYRFQNKTLLAQLAAAQLQIKQSQERFDGIARQLDEEKQRLAESANRLQRIRELELELEQKEHSLLSLQELHDNVLQEKEEYARKWRELAQQVKQSSAAAARLKSASTNSEKLQRQHEEELLQEKRRWRAEIDKYKAKVVSHEKEIGRISQTLRDSTVRQKELHEKLRLAEKLERNRQVYTDRLEAELRKVRDSRK